MPESQMFKRTKLTDVRNATKNGNKMTVNGFRVHIKFMINDEKFKQ